MPQPDDPATFTHCQVDLDNGHIYHYIDQAPQSAGTGQACVLLHGFPDLWFGWRYQIQALSSAGFRCIVPSALGYAGSSQPEDLASYSFQAQSKDLNVLLDKIGITDQVLLFGHDWGGMLAWRYAAYYPRRVAALAVVCTPYAPPVAAGTPYTELSTLVRKRVPNFGYQIFFASDEAPTLVQENLSRFLGQIFGTGRFKTREPAKTAGREQRVSWVHEGVMQARLKRMDEERASERQRPLENAETASCNPEFQYYLSTFQHHGIRHPLMYYRTRRINHEEESSSKLPQQFPEQVPVLFLTATKDEALPLAMSDSSSQWFAKGQYQRQVLPGATHWLLQDSQYRAEASRILVQWAKDGKNAVQRASKL